MFGILAFIVVLVFSVKAATAVWSEADIYREYAGGCFIPMVSLAILPLGFLALLSLSPVFGWVPAVIAAAACFLPALLGFRRRAGIFDRSGTSRTKNALNSARLGVAVSMGSLLYLGASVVLSLAVSTL